MHYRITIKGHLDHHWSDWFEWLTITHATNGETILAGVIADQAALYGMLIKIHDLGLPLIAVIPASASTISLPARLVTKMKRLRETRAQQAGYRQ